nr:hypothetical protein BaRGS_005349 [Batillaria attramentaria]
MTSDLQLGACAHDEVVASSFHDWSEIIVDVNHRLVYCPIEKVGSSFWKRVFAILRNRKFRSSIPFWAKVVSHVGVGSLEDVQNQKKDDSKEKQSKEK